MPEREVEALDGDERVEQGRARQVRGREGPVQDRQGHRDVRVGDHRSIGPLGGGAGGANYINLRNLGTSRTLVMLNGERVVSSALTNAVDLNLLPTTLLKRVDIVTGGASASYGSDAVAGVVNLVLDTNYEGFKADAQYSNNGQNAYEGYKTDVAFGTGFDGDRGHVVASFSYFDNPQFYLARQTSWNRSSRRAGSAS